MKSEMFNPKHIIPNALTLANLACGFFSLVWASEGDLIWAAVLIGLGAVIDFLDGFSARLLNASTEFGKQMDSLADMATFGLAPAFLFYQFNLFSGNNWYNLLSVLIALGVAVRLARFNIDPDQAKEFRGLPSPAFAILTASIPFIFEFDVHGLNAWILSPAFQIVFPLAGFLLMVSSIRLISLKFQDFSLGKNKIQYVFLILSIGLLVVFQFTGIPLIILAYLILSLIHNFAA